MVSDTNKHFYSIIAGLLFISMVGVFLWMYYPQLGSYPLRDWDESIYAQVARQSHDPFALTWLGQAVSEPGNLWFEKPPLVIWLIQLPQGVFGVGEFAARFSMPLFGAGLLILVFLWLRDITHSWWAGMLGAGAFFVIPNFLTTVGVLTYDIPVAFFVCAALFCYSRRQVATKYIYAFWIAVGLGVLTKSVVGVLPIFVALLDSVVFRDFTWLNVRRMWRGVALFSLIVIPWHVVETIRFGNAFWHVYFYLHIFLRGTTSFENHGAPFWYYLFIFRQHPFTELCAIALCLIAYKALRDGYNRAVLLPLLSVVVIFLFFSISVSKIVYYITPVYPIAALLIGLGLYWSVSFIQRNTIRKVLYVVILSALLLSGYQFNSHRLSRMQSPMYADIKQIADWISRQGSNAQLAYKPLFTPDYVVDSRTLLVYYTNRFVRGFEPGYALSDRDIVFCTNTHLVYKIDNIYYVAAVRYAP